LSNEKLPLVPFSNSTPKHLVVKPSLCSSLGKKVAGVGQKVKIMEGERVVFTEEMNPQNYLKLIANGDVDESMLDALEDYVKRQKNGLGFTKIKRPPTEAASLVHPSSSSSSKCLLTVPSQWMSLCISSSDASRRPNKASNSLPRTLRCSSCQSRSVICLSRVGL
jgi:hypothetical protein